MKAPTWVTRVDESPTGNPPEFPWSIVQCQCPQDCYVMDATIAIVRGEGHEPVFVCRHCASPEVREAAEAVIENAQQMGMGVGSTVKVVMDEGKEETWH